MSRWPSKTLVIGLLLGGAWPAFATDAASIDSSELQSLRENERPVVIDVRNIERFTAEHIPGAINIPEPVIRLKTLPAFGSVVVYDQGLGDGRARRAVEALNAKPGIQARFLKGGFLAWEQATTLTTKGGGLFPESIEMVTYDDLAKAVEQGGGEDITIVDLGSTSAMQVSGTKTSGTVTSVAPGPLPLKRIALQPKANVARRELADDGGDLSLEGLSSEADTLFVLVGDIDGRRAEGVARRLRAKGVLRVAVLVGGQAALAGDSAPHEVTVQTPAARQN